MRVGIALPHDKGPSQPSYRVSTMVPSQPPYRVRAMFGSEGCSALKDAFYWLSPVDSLTTAVFRLVFCGYEKLNLFLFCAWDGGARAGL